MLKGYIEAMTAGGLQLGDTLESALELGDKHEAFVNKCKTVSVTVVMSNLLLHSTSL